MKAGFSPSSCFTEQRKNSTLPLFIVSTSDYKGWLSSAPNAMKQWLLATKFSPKAGNCALVPGDDGPAGAVLTIEDPSNPFEYANAPRVLPKGNYEAEPELASQAATALCLGWALGSYRYETYKKKATTSSTLLWPDEADRAVALALAEGISLARDLVNAPASDMGPEELASEAKKLAKQHEAECHIIVGDALLKANYPMVHAVGRASSRAPRFISLTWGKKKHPKLTLVGKGVCFDTGGLDIKPPQNMKLMKKDMGGAALVLGLAHVLMSKKLPVRLRVLIPAVENSVSGNAMRPLDVLASRKGLSVEVGDTDAEGRLILADALTEACSESPDLVIDAATLTGAARVALGTTMPGIFTSKDATWREIESASLEVDDPVWRLPLHRPYRHKLSSKVADICSIGNDGYAGAILAALFLQEFVTPEQDWVHMDTMGYNLEARPGRPAGGEALGLLTLDQMLTRRFAPQAGAEVIPIEAALAAQTPVSKKERSRSKSAKQATKVAETSTPSGARVKKESASIAAQSRAGSRKKTGSSAKKRSNRA